MTTIIKVAAFEPRQLRLELEPWGEAFEIEEGSFASIAIEGGEGAVEVKWVPEGLMVWPPRGARVHVLSESGERLGEDVAPRPLAP
jgi:hypothetical protein